MEIFTHKFRRPRGAQIGFIELRSGDTFKTLSGSTATFEGTTVISGALTISGAFTLTGQQTFNVENVAAVNVITAAESGKTFFLNLAGGFTSTLPAPAAGLSYKFIVKVAPTTAYVITTNAGANILFGTVAANGAETEVNGIDIAGHDTINFVANQAKVGDWIEVISDGTNWYVRGGVQDLANLTVAVT